MILSGVGIMAFACIVGAALCGRNDVGLYKEMDDCPLASGSEGANDAGLGRGGAPCAWAR